MNTITYRQATKADINAVTALLCKLYDIHDTEELLTENEAHFANPTQAFFLAFDGDLAVGVTHVSVRHEYVAGSLGDVCGYLEAVYAEPAYRNQGVARRLVEECEAWAVGNGCTMFASDCELDNTESLKFHLSIGFEEVNRSIHFAKRLKAASVTPSAEYTAAELTEAKTSLLSTLRKCEKIQEGRKLKSSHKTLNDRRVNALRIALALIEKEMETQPCGNQANN